MIFDNRPPINLEAAELLADVERDGGAYNGVGYDRYRVYRGRKLHLIRAYSSGRDYEYGTGATSQHLGMFEDLESLGKFLKQPSRADEGFPWWASELLEELEISVEEA